MLKNANGCEGRVVHCVGLGKITRYVKGACPCQKDVAVAVLIRDMEHGAILMGEGNARLATKRSPAVAQRREQKGIFPS